MTNFKIRPPVGSATPSTQQADGVRKAEKPFRLSEESSPESASAATAITEPSALIEQLRAGQIDLDQAIDILIEKALETQPVAVASEALRQEIRQALTELVQDDPTLAALASAMKR